MTKIITISISLFLYFIFGHLSVLAAELPKIDKKIDRDKDGLSDWQEINFYKTDPADADTDKDGFSDFTEIKNGFSPHNATPRIKFIKRIEIDTKRQELAYLIDNVKINTFKISTGKPATPTPKGSFKIKNKYARAWSKKYKLWMPYWLGIKDGSFGLHELPEWPNGFKEGANHIGKPVSHGCIRLSVGQAEIIYQWADIGTPVIIK